MTSSLVKARTVVVLVLLALAAAGCGGDDDATSTTSGEPATSTTTDGAATSTTTSAPAGTVVVDIYLIDQEAFNVGTAPYEVALERNVPTEDPMKGALDALFAGPTVDESNEGIIHVGSGATGVSEVTLADGIARVHLEGGCSSGGSTLTVASEIIPTLMQFEGVEAVKIYDPEGTTEDPDGPGDSIPECLEP